MSNVAAQTMAWQRRMHNRPGPLGSLVGPTGGSGEQPTGLPQVELYIGGWVDVTALGLVRYQQAITISRGQPDETQAPQAATASFRLNNKDGRFSPRNPLSPYYGIIDKNTPVRISVQSGDTKSYRFCGEVSSWPASWDPTGNDAWVDIQAAGILRRLGTGQNALRSPVYIYWANQTGTGSAAAYWPMDDGTLSTQIASGIGGQPMSITGSPMMAASSAFVVSDPLPTLNGGIFHGRVPAYTPVPDGFGDLNNDVEMFVQVPSSGEATGAVVLSWTMTGAIPTWEVYYSTTGGGQMGCRGRNSAGTVVIDTGLTGVVVNGLVGQISATVIQNGTETDLEFAVFSPFATQVSSGFASLASTTCGIINTITVNPNGTLTGTAVGHLSVAGFTVPSLGFSAWTGYSGEPAGTRFTRLCTAAGIASELSYDPLAGPGTPMGPQVPGALLGLLQGCVDVDQGLMYELTDQVGMGYRTRGTLLNQAPAVTLDYPSSHLFDVPAPVDDDTFTRNDITLTRTNGSSARAQQLTGVMNVQNPPSGVGRYATSITANFYQDSQITDAVGWRLHLGTVPEPRYPTIGLQLARTEITSSPTLRQQILAANPGDRVVLTNPPVWLPPGQASVLVLGYSEKIDQFTHHLSWNSMPESPWRVAVTDDTTFGRADTDGSTLAAPAGPADTTIQVATTSSFSPTWTTALSDYPFDLTVGGERMTATGPGTVLNADPSMASGLTDYTLFHSSGGVDGTYQYVSGRNPILVMPDGTDTQGGLNGKLTATGSVTPSATYTVGCWVYCPQGWTDVRACIDWYDNTGTFLSTSLGSASTIAAGAWTFLTQDLTAVASAAACQPRFRWGSSPASTVQFWVYSLPVVPDSTVSSSSPQTLSVLRSVNGVVKPQAQGTSVQLYQPATVTM